LSDAAAKVEQGPEIYRQRVAFVSVGLAFSRLLIETIEDMEAYWRQKDEAIAAQAVANWKKMERLCSETPYAINWGPVRPTTPRMIGLHPAHPDPKSTHSRGRKGE